MRVAIKRLKRGKAPGEDNNTTAVLQNGGEPIVKALTQLFNRCLSDGRVPSSWKNASVVLIHKKGDTADIKNYRPISLLPVIYKVFPHNPPPADATGTRTTSAARTGWLQAMQDSPPLTTFMLLANSRKKPTNIKFHSASPSLTMRRHLTR